MTVLSERDKVTAFSPYRWQSECLEKWIEHQCRGIAHVVTGAGKTRLALMAVEHLQRCVEQPLHTIIIVPSCALMEQWVRELKNTFGNCRNIARVGGGFCGDADAEILVMVVNTARQVLPQRRNTLLAKDHAILLICDECHHYASKENRKIFSGITPDIHHYYTLGLSATPYCEGFETVLKPSLGEVIFRYGHEDARKDQIIAPFIFEQIAVSLNGTEAESYAHLSHEISAVYKKLFDCHRTLPELPSPDFFPALNRLRDRGDELSQLLFNLMMQRKRLVLEAGSRINCAEKLVEALPEDHRIIIFCERISQTEALYSLLEHKFRRQIGKYHSARASELNRRDMREYKSGSIRIMVACKALDEGIDVPEADVAIVVSGTAVERQHIQRLGRILRRSADGDKLGVLYYLYVRQSSEDSRYLPEAADGNICVDLRYSLYDGFSCTEYEDAAAAVLDALKNKGADAAQLKEARSCISDALVLADWKRPNEYCVKKAAEAAEAKDTHRENYWRCMKWMKDAGNRQKI